MKNFLKKLNQRSFSGLIILFAVLVSAWFIFSKPTALPKASEEDTYPVDALLVRAENIQPDISVFGNVRAARVAQIKSMAAGRIVSLSPFFKDGTFVPGKTELALVDPVDYELLVTQRRADVERITAQIVELRAESSWEKKIKANTEHQSAIAFRAFERGEELERKGLASKQTKDDADLVFSKAEQLRLQSSQILETTSSRILQQEANLKGAEAALAIAERDLRNTRVIAPFDGHLVGVTVANGQRVSVGETIGQLLSATELEVVFDVPENNFASLLGEQSHNGNLSIDTILERSVRVLWKLGSVTRVFRGELSRFGGEIDPGLGGIRFYATLNESAHLEGLRSGAFVEVKMRDRMYEGVLRLPSTAVTSSSLIYLIENNRLRKIDVVIQRAIGDDLLVSANLPLGGVVVSKVFPQIGEGLKVRARILDQFKK